MASTALQKGFAANFMQAENVGHPRREMAYNPYWLDGAGAPNGG